MSFLGRCRSWALDNESETLVLTAYARQAQPFRSPGVVPSPGPHAVPLPA
jgi:hypothetical protein